MVLPSMVWIEKIRPKMGTWKEGVPFVTAHEKLNGWRVTIVKKKGRIYAYTRKDDIADKIMVTHLRHALNEVPDETVLDAEIYVRDQPATSVLTGINESWPSLCLGVFAIPFSHGWDLRGEAFDTIVSGFPHIWCATVRTPTCYTAIDDDWTRQELLDFATEKKVEGFVLKQAHYDGWFKIKPQKTLDGVIVGWKEGKGKYLCTTGSVEVAVKDVKTQQNVVIANCSGMTDEERDEMYDLHKQNKLIGRVIEVKYQDVAAKGRLQFPRFVRWRPDKPAHSCTTEQLC